MNLPAVLKDLSNVARALAFDGRHHGNGLLRVGIKLGVLRIDDGHAAHFKRMHELTVRRENALPHRTFDFGGHFDRLFKRIHHRKQVLGKLLDAELLRLGNVFGGTATHVFHFGNRTHV